MAILLFSAILLGVGIHHMVATGTCSSTGYSANYGPVPKCPSGTGWWFAFLFGGIIGCLVGSALAAGLAFVFAGIFGAIGFGALTIVLDSNASTGTKLFGAIFGGCFAVVGVIAWLAILKSALSSLRAPRQATGASATPGSGGAAFGKRDEPATAFGTPEAASAFGKASSAEADPILAAYQSSHASTASAAPAGHGSVVATGAPAAPAANLIASLKQIRQAAANDSVDELTKLADLHRSGALTDAEFASAKAKLLGEI
ncbi:MAG TPA: SHOCT domain-containing protein [Solirubrobacteraceae bacterium]